LDFLSNVALQHILTILFCQGFYWYLVLLVLSEAINMSGVVARKLSG